jgi:hypothetical protein
MKTMYTKYIKPSMSLLYYALDADYDDNDDDARMMKMMMVTMMIRE